MIHEHLETNRLIIRRITMADCESIYRYMSLPAVVQFLPEEPLTLAEVREHQQANLENPLAYAVDVKRNATMVGHIVFHKIFNRYTYEIGWVFHPDFHGQGYAFESARKVIDYGFTELKLQRIIATSQTGNTRSLKLMERLGMRREGHFKEAVLKGGRWLDEYSFAILRDEFFTS